MRKTVVIFAILLLSISNSFASPIGLQKARKLAGDFFGTDISAPRLAAGGRTAVSLSGLSEPAYYIFNKDGGGFVIIILELVKEQLPRLFRNRSYRYRPYSGEYAFLAGTVEKRCDEVA